MLGPQELTIDLPIRVRGLENNGCAAVYSTKRPWFRFIPVDRRARHGSRSRSTRKTRSGWATCLCATTRT